MDRRRTEGQRVSCYVDRLFVRESREPQARRVGQRHGHRWCHLWADTPQELHAMAKRVGMRPEWFQDKNGFPHYDLVPPRRAAAVRAGAIELELADWLRSAVMICPDCRGEVRACTTSTLLGDFRECPLCGVGSPREEWKTKEPHKKKGPKQ